jgi:peroxiredoxin
VVLGINTSDERESGKEWARKTGLTYPIAFDEGNQAARSFGVENLPTLVVVDKQGKIAAVRTGLTDDAELERLLTQLF